MKRIVLLISLCMSVAPAFSQDSSNALEKFASWMDKQKISIRKSFESSSKDENKPATFFWSKDYKEGFNYFTADMAIKIKELELLKKTNSVLIFFPKVEWHKDSRDSVGDKFYGKSLVTGGINVEFYPIPIKPKGDESMKGWAIAPWIQGSSEYKHDNIKKNKTISVKGYLSLFSDREFLPGDQWKVNGMLFFRYYPYTGLEYYRNDDKSNKEAQIWASRLFFELWPIPIQDKQYVQLTFDYTYRDIIEDDLYNNGSMEYFTAGINVYPDGLGKLGIGLEYSSGDDPTAEFIFSRKMSFGLRFNF